MRGSGWMDRLSLATRGNYMNEDTIISQSINAASDKNKNITLEELEAMTPTEVKDYRLPKSGKKILNKLLAEGIEFVAAKRIAIARMGVIVRGMAPVKEEEEMQQNNITESSSTTSLSMDPRNISKHNEVTFKNASPNVQVAVTLINYPEITMTNEEMSATQLSIIDMLTDIPDTMQIRLGKCYKQSGYLLYDCIDSASIEWLISIVPDISPWEGAKLKAITGNQVHPNTTCTTYVPNICGVRFSPEKILKLLKASNNGLNTDLWSLCRTSENEFGQSLTFLIDGISLDVLRELEMRPYFSNNRLQFRVNRNCRRRRRDLEDERKAARIKASQQQPGSSNEQYLRPKAEPDVKEEDPLCTSSHYSPDDTYQAVDKFSLTGNQLPPNHKYTTYVPYTRGVQYSTEQMLKLLEASNWGLSTHSWSLCGQHMHQFGQTFTFSIDNTSLEALKGLQMRPHFSNKRLKFSLNDNFGVKKRDLRRSQRIKKVQRQQLGCSYVKYQREAEEPGVKKEDSPTTDGTLQEPFSNNESASQS